MGKISVGIAGAIGVLVGILIAPRKGSETREEIIRRSEPLQEAARKAASRVGDAVKPVTKMVGERVPLTDRGKNSSTSEGPEDGPATGRKAKPEKVTPRN